MQAQAVDEPDNAVFDVDDEDDEDDTYIDDGVVALVNSAVQGQDDDFLFDTCTILFGVSRDNEPFNLFGVLIESVQIF